MEEQNYEIKFNRIEFSGMEWNRLTACPGHCLI